MIRHLHVFLFAIGTLTAASAQERDAPTLPSGLLEPTVYDKTVYPPRRQTYGLSRQEHVKDVLRTRPRLIRQHSQSQSLALAVDLEQKAREQLKNGELDGWNILLMKMIKKPANMRFYRKDPRLRALEIRIRVVLAEDRIRALEEEILRSQ